MSLQRNRPIRFPCLEPEQLRSWLGRDVEWPDGVQLRNVRLSRLWVGRHGRLSFELALDLESDGTRQTCLLQGRGGDVSQSRVYTRARISRNGLKGLRLFNSELGLCCCTPDRDRDLPSVRVLIDEKRAASALLDSAVAPRLGLTRDSQRVECEITAYRASKRCSLRVHPVDSEGSDGVFIKVFRRAPSKEQIESWRRLSSCLDDRSGGRVCAPEVLDVCATKRWLITSAVTESARPLGRSDEARSAAAAALATLHDLPVATTFKTHTLADEFQTVCRWVQALRCLGQERYRRLRALSVELSQVVKTIGEPGATLVHRDFFAAQLLWSDDRVWLLDFDTLCSGHPEVDVATFVAHLFLDGLVDGLTGPEITQQAAYFVEEYRRHGGRTTSARLRFYLSCALARLGAIHSARGVPARVIDELWKLAEDHLVGLSWLD